MVKTNVSFAPWLRSRQALVILGVIAFIVAYALGSRALDTGSYWEYLGCVLALGFSIKFIVRAIRKEK